MVRANDTIQDNGGSECWDHHAEFLDCCDVVRWGPGGRPSCWEARPGFDRCCIEAVLEGCALGCGANGEPLLAGVSARMCEDSWEVRVCDLGEGPPQVALYSQWSPSYLMTLAWMLRSLRLAGDGVRVVLRQVWDTRNVTSGDQFSWGPTGYERQRAVRARWFESVVKANWDRTAVISDTDIEYFPGWLETVGDCLDSDVDLCVGQQPGWDGERHDGLNPGFMALRCGDRTRKMFETMLGYGNIDGQSKAELWTFNHALHTHPPNMGGPRWAVFHPEVVVTGIKGMEIRILRVRVHHAATGQISHKHKEKAVQRIRALQFRLRKFCMRLDAGRFPVHPICIPAGEFPVSVDREQEDFREGKLFNEDDFQQALLEYNGVLGRWRGDRVFKGLLIDGKIATGSAFPEKLCLDGSRCDGEDCCSRAAPAKSARKATR